MTFNVPDNTVENDGNWSTVGMPKALMTSGIPYYELGVLKVGEFTLLEFALEGVLPKTDVIEYGAGAFKGSWSVD